MSILLRGWGAPSSKRDNRDREAMNERKSTAMADWSYQEAFARNLGLISAEEQDRLQASRVAIIGMGGVGGVHLETLARLGIGRFTIADPDTFDVANTNRQYGAKVSTLGRSKTEVMAAAVRDINPEVELRVFPEMIGPENAAEFLRDADLFVDGIDFYSIDVRRLLFRQAASQGIYGITAAPAGFGTAWLIFDPRGLSFDEFFDMADEMDQIDKVVAMAVGVAPKALQSSYMNLRDLNLRAKTAPCCGAACHLACGVVGVEAIKILLHRGRIRPAPYYHQFDPFIGRFVTRRLYWGNRHPWQRLKRWILAKRFREKLNN